MLSVAPRAVKGNVADIFIAAEWVVNGNDCALPIEIVFKCSNRLLAPSPPWRGFRTSVVGTPAEGVVKLGIVALVVVIEAAG